MFKAPRGTKDFLPLETNLISQLEQKAKNVFKLFGYQEIRTPIIEEMELFIRSLGTDTEIVQKQMFMIKRENDNLVLRPEATASIARAYLQHHLDKKEGLSKFFYIGPMFRGERPQRGRLRQFHHLGAEVIGSFSAYFDVEIISLMIRILKELNVGGYILKINTLGCLKDKMAFSKLLKEAIKDKKEKLCLHCQRRYHTNTFRILDCKNPQCQKIIRRLSFQRKEYLCKGCLEHFLELKEILKILNIEFKEDEFLVRGLDYYNRTVFEVFHPSLGSQDALGAGGRYDYLFQQLTYPHIGAVGFALGIERLLLVIDKACFSKQEKRFVFIAALGEEAKKEGFHLLSYLREHNLSAEMDFQDRSLKAKLRYAHRLNFRYVVILGEEELRTKKYILKDLVNSQQQLLKKEALIKKLSILKDADT